MEGGEEAGKRQKAKRRNNEEMVGFVTRGLVVSTNRQKT